MAEYALSIAAEGDLRKIYRYSLEEFGQVKATAYMQSLEECFQMLVANPDVGKDISHIRPDYLQFSHDRHAIFFQKDGYDLLIIRVLHGTMAIDKHL